MENCIYAGLRVRLWLIRASEAAASDDWPEAIRHCVNALDLLRGLQIAKAKLCADCADMDKCHDNSTPGTKDRDVWLASENCDKWRAKT
jgi:hypothetical protein